MRSTYLGGELVELVDNQDGSINLTKLNQESESNISGAGLLHEGEYLGFGVQEAVDSGFNISRVSGATRAEDDHEEDLTLGGQVALNIAWVDQLCLNISKGNLETSWHV